jgi:NAD(P)-dependent dehydrogenase (short-subunit alcohol dehydrogenase family)
LTVPTQSTGRRVLVTGAASGIGEATVARFVEDGATVFAVDAAAAVRGRANVLLKGDGHGRILPIVCDIAATLEVDRLFDSVRAQGPLDVLVNCAGVTGDGRPFLDLDVAEWDRVMNVNARGTFLVSLAGAQLMQERGTGGVIINVTSQVSERAGPRGNNNAHYVASKGALNQLTRALAVELAAHGIRVVALGPGLVETPLNEARRQDGAWVSERLDRIPLGRFAKPGEIAEAIHWLSSSQASYVTGTLLLVDGGYTAW